MVDVSQTKPFPEAVVFSEGREGALVIVISVMLIIITRTQIPTIIITIPTILITMSIIIMRNLSTSSSLHRPSSTPSSLLLLLLISPTTITRLSLLIVEIRLRHRYDVRFLCPLYFHFYVVSLYSFCRSFLTLPSSITIQIIYLLYSFSLA